MSSYEFAAEEIVSLPPVPRLRLRSVEPASVAALRNLFGVREVLCADGGGLTWRFRWLSRSEPRRRVILRGEGMQLLLGLVADGLREPLGSREWWDYDEDSSLLAWTLAHATLLESLGRLLSESLMPDGWMEPTEPGSAGTVLLGFSVSNGEQEIAGGQLSIQPQALAKLAAAHATGEGVAADLELWAQRLEAELHVVLPSVEFPRLDLLAGSIGDVFVLGGRTRCWEGLALRYATRAWRCFYDQGRIEVASGALDDSTRTFMSQPISAETDGGARVSSLESIPVSLEFDLGSLTVPLGELAALKPGYVFELPTRLEHARVVIRANGTPIGHGELVAAGDTLGVQLLSIDANGLR